MKRDVEKYRAWQRRSQEKSLLKRTASKNGPGVPIKRCVRPKQRSRKRSFEELQYATGREVFLETHRVCPVTGGRATQIHHSAGREGRWLLIQRYWIGLSDEGHKYVEAHKRWAANRGLIVRIEQTADDHIADLIKQDIDLHHPIFYDKWDGETFFLQSLKT